MGFTTVAALAGTVIGEIAGSSADLPHLFYIPVALAAYRYLWPGAAYSGGLALAYLVSIAITSAGEQGAIVTAAVNASIFVAVACSVAWLAQGARRATTRMSGQRDLAFDLDRATTFEEVARRGCRALMDVDEIDAVLVYLRQDDDSYAMAAHEGVSAEFAEGVSTLDPGSGSAQLIAQTTPRWDVFARVLQHAGLGEDQVLDGEGICGVGILPIVHEGITLGSLVVGSRRHFRFREDTTIGVEIVAAQVAGALLRLHSATQLHSQHAQTEVLYQAARELTSTLDYDEVLARVAEQVTQAAGSDECHIWGYDAATNSQSCLTVYSRDGASVGERPQTGMRLDPADHPSATVMMSGDEPWELSLSDPDIPPEERALMERLGNKTTLHVPLAIAGRSIGRLVLVERHGERHFVAGELRLVQALGEHAAVAIENALLYASAEEQNRRLQALLEATRAVGSSMDLGQVLFESARAGAHALGVTHCTLCEYDEDGESLVFRVLFPSDASPSDNVRVGTRVPLRPGRAPWRVIHQQAIVQEHVGDPGLDPLSKLIMERGNERSALSVPLVHASRALGLLTLIETERERTFTPAEIELAQAVADQAGVAINNARLYQAVEMQATHDGLTGLFNHRYFHDRLVDELSRAKRYVEPLSVLMIDIDDFKQVNDRYGHPAGDEVLHAIGLVLSAQVRRGVDLAARYGGEELALILPNTPAHHPHLVARPARDDIGATARRDAGSLGNVAEGSGHAVHGIGAAAAGHAASDTPAGPASVAVADARPPRPEGALAVAERVRAVIAASTYATGAVPGGVRVTVSIGVAAYQPGEACTPGRLVSSADEALYAAKRAGKNRTVVADIVADIVADGVADGITDA